MEDNLVQAEYVVPDMMLVGAIQPNMIIAAALGAEFVYFSDKDSDVKGFPLKDIIDSYQLLPVEEVLDTICEVENLATIDTNSNTSLKAIRNKMGRDFEINVFPPVEVLGESAQIEDIEKWLNRTLEDNDGGNLKIEYHLEPDYNWENCRFIHEEFDKRGLVKKGRLY